MFPQYIINVPHLLEHEQDGLSRATVTSLAGSLTSLCFGPTMVKDDIAAVAARHQRAAGDQERTALGTPATRTTRSSRCPACTRALCTARAARPCSSTWRRWWSS